jgi:hypothetical protein
MELSSNNPEFNILSEGVQGVGKVVGRVSDVTNSEISAVSVDDEGNLDEDELDEIDIMPIVHGVYYDPWSKSLKCDTELLKVVVNPQWTLQECIEEAETYYGERFFELEKKGNLMLQSRTQNCHFLQLFFDCLNIQECSVAIM